MLFNLFNITHSTKNRQSLPIHRVFHALVAALARASRQWARWYMRIGSTACSATTYGTADGHSTVNIDSGRWRHQLIAQTTGRVQHHRIVCMVHAVAQHLRVDEMAFLCPATM